MAAKRPTPKPKVEPPRDPGRFVSKNRLGPVLGRNAATINAWVADGMPAVVVGDAKAGRDWIFEIAAVVKWREGVVARKARAEAGGGKENESLPIGHPLHGVEPKDRPMVIQRYVNLAIAQKMAVSVGDVAAIRTRTFRNIGATLMSIPELAARNLRGFPEADVRAFVKASKTDINAVLRDAAASEARAIHALTSGGDPYAEADDEIDATADAD
jgi:phage terminase Nu1 subunit (DNA packaging protein)